MDDFQDISDRFLAWFKKQGGTFRDDLIELRDLRDQGAGRGIVAINDILQDTVLFTIPRAAIINIETSDLARRIPGIFDHEIGKELPLDPWASLILVMIYEYLQGKKSKWQQYFDILPEVFDTPIFWSESELKELQGTCLTKEKIGKYESDAMFKARVIPIIQNNPSIFCSELDCMPDEEDLLGLAHRMGSVIMAYAFDLEKDENEDSGDEQDGWVEDRDILGMVPMADMMNANAEFNAHVNHDTSLEITALRTRIPKGTEILNYYGPLPSSELLRRYGYLMSDHHRYDIVEITWDAVKKSLWKHFPELKPVHGGTDGPFGEDVEEIFIMERDSGDPDEEGQLSHDAKLIEIAPELKDQFKAYLRARKEAVPALESDAKKRKDLYHTVLAEVLLDKLLAYPTTIIEDEKLLAQENITKRHRMAIEVRLGEKKLLMEGINLVSKTSTREVDQRNPKKAKTT